MVRKSDVLVEEAEYVQQGCVGYRETPASTLYPACIQPDLKNHKYLPCCDTTDLAKMTALPTRGMHSLVERGKHTIHDLQKKLIPDMGMANEHCAAECVNTVIAS